MKVYHYKGEVFIPLTDRLVVIGDQDVRDLEGFEPEAEFTESVGHKKAIAPVKQKKIGGANEVLTRRSPKGSNREKVLELIAKGLNDKEISEKIGISVPGVYYHRNSGVKKQQERRGATAKNSKEESNDFGLGFTAIGIIIQMKRDSEKTDEEIAEEMDISVDQVRTLWKKWQGDPRFKHQFN